MGSVQGESVPINSQNSRRVNPLTSRKEKVPELLILNEFEDKKYSKELKIRKESRVPKEIKDDGQLTKQSC